MQKLQPPIFGHPNVIVPLSFFATFSLFLFSFPSSAGVIELGSLSLQGNGCPNGSVGHLFSEDRTVLELLFDQFQANLQPSAWGAPAYPASSSCRVNLVLIVQPGWSVSWYRTEHRGYIDTVGGATGLMTHRYRVVNTGAFDRTFSETFPSGMAEYFTKVHDISPTWSSCLIPGLTARIDGKIQLSGTPTAYNTFTIDAQSHAVKTTLRFALQRCP